MHDNKVEAFSGSCVEYLNAVALPFNILEVENPARSDL